MSKSTTPAPDYFRATGAELKDLATSGDKAAQAEIDRRKAKRAAKAAAAQAIAA